MRTFVRLFAVVIACLLSSCSDAPPPTNGGSHIPHVESEGEWLVVKIGEWRRLSEDMWLSFYGHPARAVEGRAACNYYIAEIAKYTDTEIEFSSVGMTALGCPDDLERMDDEFASALKSTRYYRKSPDRMEFFDAQLHTTILFHAVTQWPHNNYIAKWECGRNKEESTTVIEW